MFNVNKETSIKTMNNSKMAEWVAYLVDKYSKSNLTIEEKKLEVKSHFINCAEFQNYKLEDCDLEKLNNKVNIMYN